MGVGITMIGTMTPFIQRMLEGHKTKYDEAVKAEVDAVRKMDSAHWRISGTAWTYIKRCYELIDEMSEDIFIMTEKMLTSEWDEIEKIVNKNLICDDLEDDEEASDEIMKIFRSLYEVSQYRRMFIIN